MAVLSLSLLALAGSALGADLPSLQMKGAKFFYPNGTQFIMKGVAYQQDTGAAGTTPSNASFVDPLADETRCKQDVPLLAQLGTNIIRTYAIDPTKDHSACMQLLNDAGIYVISDLSEPSTSINREKPAWDTTLYTRYTAVIDELSKYSNVLGFFAGNEVSNAANNTAASAYVKAATRDMKQYIKDTKKRWMGVGYAANDDVDIRDAIASYLNCGNASQSIDYFGYNIYSWCGTSDFEHSGYNRLIEFFKDYSVPVFFAEYGCQKNGGAADRKFLETEALYQANMSDVVSGGIVYEYFEEANDYGLVKISSDGGAPSKLADFAALQKEVAAADPKGVSMSSYNPTNQAMACPPVNATWGANSTLPPTPSLDACGCAANASTCVPSSSLSAESYGDIFDTICGSDQSLCAGINGNATTGVYGTFSMCSSVDKLAIVMGAYYQKNKGSQGNSACDFKGGAKTQTGSGDSTTKCAAKAPSGGTTGNSSGSGSGGSEGSGAGVHGPMATAGLGGLVALLAGMLLM